jgi:PAS domain S-box-containing protein
MTGDPGPRARGDGRRAVTLRATLAGMALVAVVYVVGLVLEIVVVIAPAASTLRGNARDLLAQHDAIRLHLETLRSALDSVNVLRARATPVAPADASRLTEPIRIRLDSVVAMQASQALGTVPAAMRLALAEAVETETKAGLTMLDVVRAMESGRADEASAGVRSAEALLDSTALHLQAAQGTAIADLLARENTLHAATALVSRWAIAWGALGAILLTFAVWLVRQRIYRPIARLERAVAKVTTGDLTAAAEVQRDDELGRLATHFNAMTAVLRERAAEQTRRHENLTERFGRILDESSNEIYLIDASTLRFVQANRGALANLGYTMAELGALSPLEVLRDLPRESFEAALAALRHGEQSSILLSASQARKDGSVYPVELRLQLSTAGDPPVYIAVVEDVSERSRVRELNERLRLFAMTEHRRIASGDLTAALGAITEMAADTLRVARTGAWLYHPDRLTCLDLFDRAARQHVTRPEIRWQQQRAYLMAARDGEPIAAHDAQFDPRTRDLTHPGGPRADVTSQLDVPVRAGGRLVAFVTHEHTGPPRRWTAEDQAFAASVADFVALAMEAAERSRLEEQLAKAQKMDSIGRLAGGVAHDFNNMLTAILGNVEFAQLTVPTDAPIRGELEEIEKAARRAAELTRQLLTFARHQVVQPKVLDVNELTRGADKLLRRLLGEDVELVTLLASDLAAVRIDPGQLEQVIVNLAVNARDAMPNGGRLTIETRNIALDSEYAASHANAVPGEYVQLAVSDTGHGMTRETLSRLFEPFFTTKGPGQGTGLGLAICYGIVRQAGGNIWAYSEPGQGTTFKVHLPKVDAPAEPLTGEEHDTAPPRGRETILLVEDEDQIREIASRALRAQGYTVIVAANGEEAIAFARDRAADIDLVVTDIVLPLVGGREVATRIRRERPGMPVIYMSGYTRGVIPDPELLGPGTLFLSKPFTPSELARRVRELLDRGGLPAGR